MSGRYRWWRTVVAGAVVLVALAGLVWRLGQRLPVPDMGVSHALALERASRVGNLKYTVSIKVPSVRSEPVTGRITATFVLLDASRPLALDFRSSPSHVRRVSVAGRSVTASVASGHLILPASALVQGTNVVDVEFIAGEASLNRNEDYLYTLFVPARASYAMPCFDQPDLKARWSLTLDLPNGWAAVSNGRESGHVVSGDRISVLFDETPPLPPYLFAFAAGRFQVESAQRDGRTFRLFHRETDQTKVARNRDAVFDLHAQALRWLEEYTAIPYPFAKFDMVLLPAFQFSGMEHPGAVYYNASGLLLEPSATQNQLLNRASLIAHETAHMWFGNLVTMTWFDDVWLKEVFANLMAAKIVNPSFPGVNHDLRFLLQHVPAAYDVDRTAGANPIRQDLVNLDEAGSLYGAIIYQKAPVAMRQLEMAMGPDTFRDGLREFLDAHRFGNADWPALVALLDRRSPLDLRAWSEAWIGAAGRPTIRTVVDTNRGRVTKLAFVQEESRGRGIFWPEQLSVIVESQGRIRRFDVRLNGTDTTVPDAVGIVTPTWVLPTGRGTEYGFFDLDPGTLAYLTAKLPSIGDPLTRGTALVTLWEAMLEGRVEPDRVFRLITDAIGREADELNVQLMLDQLRVLFWRFTGPDDRQAAAATLEPALRRGLERARSVSLKSAWLNAFRSIALTPNGLAWLAALWRHDVSIPGLPLTETDETDLAFDLSLREVEHADAILGSQRDRITNPDRRARFEFLMPAVSADVAVRDGLFSRLEQAEYRVREAWVVDAIGYLNHPLRAAESRRYLRRALELIPEIHRTGDIFFPKRWADAVLSGYQSVQTAADVREFIETLPQDYPPRLRWVLLSAADPLFRAAAFQQQ